MRVNNVPKIITHRSSNTAGIWTWVARFKWSANFSTVSHVYQVIIVNTNSVFLHTTQGTQNILLT